MLIGMASKRDRVLERAFQEHVVQIGQSHGGFVSKFKPNKVRAMKVRVAPGHEMAYVQRLSSVRVEVYIYFGKTLYKESLKAFEALFKHKSAIEADFGAELWWDDRETRNACRVRLDREGFDLHDRSCWDDYATWMVEHMDRLHQALLPYIE